MRAGAVAARSVVVAVPWYNVRLVVSLSAVRSVRLWMLVVCRDVCCASVALVSVVVSVSALGVAYCISDVVLCDVRSVAVSRDSGVALTVIGYASTLLEACVLDSAVVDSKVGHAERVNLVTPVLDWTWSGPPVFHSEVDCCVAAGVRSVTSCEYLCVHSVYCVCAMCYSSSGLLVVVFWESAHAFDWTSLLEVTAVLGLADCLCDCVTACVVESSCGMLSPVGVIRSSSVSAVSGVVRCVCVIEFGCVVTVSVVLGRVHVVLSVTVIGLVEP